MLLPACCVVCAALYSQVSNSAPNQSHFYLYLGNYSDRINAYNYDSKTGEAEPLAMQDELKNPSFVAVDPHFKYLYAVSELDGEVNGGVGAFAIDRATGKLRKLNTRSSEGQAPCHISVDHSGKLVLVANYGTGEVTVYPINPDGSLGPTHQTLAAKGSSVNKQRQSGPHAHEAVWSPDNRFVYVPDLGLDHIRIYKLDAGGQNLSPNDPPFAQLHPGNGPRHIVISTDGKFAYVANELTPVVTTFSRNTETGALTQIQELSILPEGATGDNGPAEIAIGPAGKFVYVSNRGPGTVAVFAIDHGAGTLRPVEVVKTGGTWPRAFEFDPSGQHMLVGDQKADSFVEFDVDSQTGKLTASGKKWQTASPVSFLFVPSAK
jgi:6-phosphogluconolactonase